jgi:hypothetical protein
MSEFLPPLNNNNNIFNVSDFNYQDSYISYYTGDKRYSKLNGMNTFTQLCYFNGGITTSDLIVNNSITSNNLSVNSLYLGQIVTDPDTGILSGSGSFFVLDGLFLNSSPLKAFVNIKNLTTDAQTQLNQRAPINNPSLTGIPICPLPNGLNTSQIANVNYVNNSIANIQFPVTDLSNYVDKSSVETISGSKTFSTAITTYDLLFLDNPTINTITSIFGLVGTTRRLSRILEIYYDLIISKAATENPSEHGDLSNPEHAKEFLNKAKSALGIKS